MTRIIRVIIKTIFMFTKEERGKFGYTFAHWCAFNMTALNLRCWRFRFLFHDVEKPFLRIFLPYEKVQKIHRGHSRHHIEYIKNGHITEADWLSLVIDWESSRFTKESAQMTARETMERKYPEWRWKIEPILDELGL